MIQYLRTAQGDQMMNTFDKRFKSVSRGTSLERRFRRLVKSSKVNAAHRMAVSSSYTWSLSKHENITHLNCASNEPLGKS